MIVETETFVSLLHDAAHWEFELFLMAVFDGVIGCLLWPFVRKHWQHHVRRDEQDVAAKELQDTVNRRIAWRRSGENLVGINMVTAEKYHAKPRTTLKLPDGYCNVCNTPDLAVIHESLKADQKAEQDRVNSQLDAVTQPYSVTVAEMWKAAGLEKPEERMGTCDVSSISHRQYGWCKNWKPNRSR